MDFIRIFKKEIKKILRIINKYYIFLNSYIFIYISLYIIFKILFKI